MGEHVLAVWLMTKKFKANGVLLEAAIIRLKGNVITAERPINE